MKQTLRASVVTVLRTRGFEGSFPHFRRFTEQQIQLLTFQFNKWGGSFVVEIAVAPADGIIAPWGEHIVPQQVTTHSVHPTERYRLGTNEDDGGTWFRYNRSFPWIVNPYRRAARAVLSNLNDAERWWQSRSVSRA